MAGVAKYNENAKIELFSRTAGGATGIKTATSAWARRWGSREEEISPRYEGGCRKWLILGILIPLFLCFPWPPVLFTAFNLGLL